MSSHNNGGREAKPKLGQNFLVDETAIARIVASLGDISQTTVVEIGPGRAAITRALALTAGRLIAIELDRVLASQLRLGFSRHTNVEIVECDVLQADFAAILGQRPGPLRDLRPSEPLKGRVVGNLPYYITSDILLRLFKYASRIEMAVLMTQLEVAERICATPGHREYGLLSVTTQLYCRPQMLFKLPGSAFNPPPKVESAVTRLFFAPRFQELEVEEQPFIDFVKILFAQKRKTLANNLKEHYDKQQIADALATADLAPTLRAEAIAVEGMARLFKIIGPPAEE